MSRQWQSGVEKGSRQGTDDYSARWVWWTL